MNLFINKLEVIIVFKELVDIKEDNILQFDCELLSILLKDNSSNKNIIWGTDNYSNKGYGYNEKDYITIQKITGVNGEVIKPRTRKTKEEQERRIRNKAEVFTPSWICNKQNNLIDNEWFEKKNIFNQEEDKYWICNENKIEFPKEKTWKEYIELLRLEISCGEAPYLASRYDTVSGKTIELKNRIGMLDRKFRILNENIDDYDEWIKWSKIAVQSLYGYDWQGDNVLLARENILYTYSDNYKYKFNKKPSTELIKEIANIISWNIWQMDGINFIIPYSCKNDTLIEYTIFGEEEHINECIGCRKNNIHKHNGIYCKIMNWKTNRTNKFINLVDRSK
jgi:hypothetical protein